MEATWDIMFTESFKKDVDKFSNNNIEKYLRKIELLKTNPYSSNTNVKFLKGVARRFRLRVGKVRIIYRILTSTKKIQLLRIAFRKNVYDQKTIICEDSVGFLEDLYPSGEVEKSNELNGNEEHSDEIASPFFQEINHSDSEDNLILEEITNIAIDRDELFLIGIPEKYHDGIISANSLAFLAENGIEKKYIDRIEDYLTNPESTHVGKLYSLDGNGTFASIASQSFLDFIVELDPQQREIVRKPLNKGPFMVRGGPGTGKTLICLERLRRMYQFRVTETLFSDEKQNYLFVTYTNSLVDASRRIFDILLPNPKNVTITFSTLDHIVTSFTAIGTEGNLSDIPNRGRLRAIIALNVIKPMKALRGDDVFQKLITRFSFSFFLDEFDDVINGNCLATFEDYLNFKRVGRKIPLQKRQREVIWAMYKEFNKQLDKKGLSTWGRRRLDIWRALESGSLIPRKKFNVLVVDELQDISTCAVKILLHLAVDPRFIMFAADTGQSIYSKSPVDSNIHPNLLFHKGNSCILKRSYRMTKQISTAIRPLRCDLDNKSPIEMDSNVAFTGPTPHWVELEASFHGEYVVECVEGLIKNKMNINPGQIGIISRTKEQLSHLRTLFNKKGIDTNLVAKRNAVNLTKRTINLLTIHSAKGMEFPIVFVPHVNDSFFYSRSRLNSYQDENEKKEFFDSEARLLYVALSRAARELWMLVDPQNPSLLLSRMSKENWDIS